MGVCQSYFGASTSGQGFTAVQLAACIRAAGKEATDAVQNSDPKYKDQKDLCKDTSVLEKKDGITPEIVAGTNHTTTIESQGQKFDITSFAGGVFKQLRALEHISDEFFDKEWVLPEDHLGLKESEGRSRAMFLVSNHRCLLCKTVSEGEVITLLSMLPSLASHLAANPNSLLQRFVLAMRIQEQQTKEIGWVVVFTDVFAKCPAIHEKWDLKGRKPKAAKYLFFPPAEEIPDDISSSDDDEDEEDDDVDENGNEKSAENSNSNNGQQQREDAGEIPQGASTAKQLRKKQERKAKKQQQQKQQQQDNSDTTSMGSPSVTSPVVNQTDVIDQDTEARPTYTKIYRDGYERVIARKDKELTRVFWIPKKDHGELQSIIKRDANYLADQGILDYSILLGVQYRDPSSDMFKEMRFNALYHPKTCENEQNINSSNNNLDEILREMRVPVEARTTCDGVELDAQSRFHKGIPSSASVEHYYIGIIDMLTSYTFLKKSANFWKNCLWNDETLSTVPPDFYRSRFVEFMEKCIVVGPDATKKE